MNYTPHTQNDIEEMLKEIGLQSIDDLFSHLPEELMKTNNIDLADGLSELEVSKRLQEIAKKNKTFSDYSCFLGGGVYDHYVPPVVDALASRSEFYTAYTPYQPEASQGALQAMIEYQTSMSRLTQMDISNASLYDGSSAMAEAVLMALEITGKDKVIISKTIHPEWIEVVKCYTIGRDIEIVYVDHQNGETNWSRIKELVDENTACLCIQSPNFFGVIEDYREIKKDLQNALLVVGTYPFSLGFLKAPGEFGADIVVGDGQSLGNYVGFGGPHYGFLTCKKEYIRKIPGRIVGETEDSDSHKGFCLTFQTREQHIRREKATSNICSNQALIALRTVIYLALLGEEGLREASSLAYHKAHYLQQRVNELPSFRLHFDKPFYNEFVIHSRVKTGPVNQALYNEGFIGGLDLEKFDDSYENLILLAVTEKRTKEEMDRFVKVLEKFN